MTSAHDEPTLDDVLENDEPVPHTRREHGGMPPRRLDDDELAERTEHEREVVHGRDERDDVPDAED